jgi:hypothetical protein
MLRNGDIKIVQIATESGNGPYDRKPYLFCLDESGIVYVWNWIDKCYTLIDQLED